MAVTIITKQSTHAENLDNGITGVIAWSNPERALLSDNNYANVDFGDSTSGITQYLYVHDFEFDLPDTAVINGVIASVERKGVGVTEDYYVGLAYTSTDLIVTSPGKQKGDTWPDTDIVAQYGNSTDTWNHTWLPSEVNDTSFGLALSAEGAVAQNDAALVDNVEMTIYWHQEITPEISGGGGCSGTADIYMPTAGAKAKVQVSGTAQVDCRYLIGLTSGGAFAYGSSIAHDFIQPVGGSTASGLISSPLTYNPTPSNGLAASGEAVDNIIDAFVMDGGAKVYGSSIAHDFIQPVGGSTASLSSVSEWTYNPTPSGGLVGIGVGFVDPVYMEGGSTASGTAVVEATYDVESGGTIECNGRASVGIEVPVEGGSVAGGAAEWWATFIPAIDSVGVTGHGYAFIDPYLPTGGMAIPASPGESADIIPYWYPVETANAITSGEAVDTMVFDPALGQYQWTFFLSGGELTVPQYHGLTAWAYCWLHPETNEFGWDIRFDDFTANVIRLRGPADFGVNGDLILKIEQVTGVTSPNIGSFTITELQKADLLAGLWYIWIMTSDDEQLRGQVTESQTGISISGSHVISHWFTSEGGSTASGSSDVSVEYTHVPSKGSIVGSSAFIGIASSIGGGISVDGSVVGLCVYNPSTSGGTIVTGNARETVNYAINTSGGTIVDGIGVIGIAPAIGGGTFAYGSHVRSYTAGPSMIGGAAISPLHRQAFIDYYIAYGSIRVGGKGKREYIRYIPPSRHLGYCRAMGSENICTTITYEKELITPTNAVSPELEEGRFRIQHAAGWCDVEERCEEGVLPKVIQKRQKGLVPDKLRSDTPRNRSIATIDAI